MRRQRWRRLPRIPASRRKDQLTSVSPRNVSWEVKPIVYFRKTTLCLWFKDNQLGFTIAGLSNVHLGPETNQPA